MLLILFLTRAMAITHPSFSEHLPSLHGRDPSILFLFFLDHAWGKGRQISNSQNKNPYCQK